MKTDRELLELAAKAAGHELKWIEDAPHIVIYPEGAAVFAINWDPLNDDGDALRLAVKLSISFCKNDMFAFADMEKDPYEPEFEFAFAEELRSDPCAATRRAIARAAAEIGDKMK